MTGSNHKSAALQWSVFVTKRRGLNRELPPGYESLAWVPNSSTLIYGERDEREGRNVRVRVELEVDEGKRARHVMLDSLDCVPDLIATVAGAVPAFSRQNRNSRQRRSRFTAAGQLARYRLYASNTRSMVLLCFSAVSPETKPGTPVRSGGRMVPPHGYAIESGVR
jgi:hypothetical protein